MASDRNPGESPALTWALIVIAIGAIVGIAAAAALLGRKDRAQAEDPDAPLFI